MSDDEKKEQMSDEELAKMWENMAGNEGDASGLAVEGSDDESPMSEDISSSTDTMGLSGALKDKNKTSEDAPNIDFLLDIPLAVSAELGRTKMIIYELLQLSQGSVLELNKLAGEPLDLRVNDKLIARGEAVVVNEKFGVRITDIVNPQERLENLKGEE